MPFFDNKSWPDHKNRPILFIDLEMTGLDVDRHEIIEVAALVVSQPDLNVVNSYYAKIKPTHLETADQSSLSAINFDMRNWHDAIDLKICLTELSQLAPTSILAGWSVENEWNFLISGLKEHNLPFFFDNYLIEVWTMAFAHFRQSNEISRISIGNVCRHMGIPLDQHKPDSDIRATYEIFKRLITKNPSI